MPNIDIIVFTIQTKSDISRIGRFDIINMQPTHTSDGIFEYTLHIPIDHARKFAANLDCDPRIIKYGSSDPELHSDSLE